MISVVIATHERSDRVTQLVTALARQGLDRPFEIVVVDDGSNDDTTPAMRRIAASADVTVKALRLETNAGPATARNAGWRAARAELVAFTDDDCTPQPGWLAALVRELADADLVQGRTLPDPSQEPRISAFSRSVSVGGDNGFYETCNMAYRKDLLERLGGFDEGFRMAAGEDTDLAYRAFANGARYVFAADALVFHDVVSPGPIGYIKNCRRWFGVVQVVHKHPELRRFFSRGPIWLRRHALALATLVAIAVGAALRDPFAALVAVAVVALYVRHRLTIVFGAASSRARWRDLPVLLVADLTELAVHVVAQVAVRYRLRQLGSGPR